ncbi:MAG TPA: hypothetical protein VKQ30_06625 [Ktedonobacterales bacterium]|nr:hypothetical protein [Ktedonobacterales bacterium]
MSGITIDTPLRTLVLDPDEAQQAMVRGLLEEDGRFVVVGTFAPRECAAADGAAFTPDLILLDPWDGEELDLALVGTLVGSVPRARIVLRTNFFTLGALVAVTALGVSGYLVKLSHPIPQLCDALALAGRTGIFVCAQSITNCVRAQLTAQSLLGQPLQAGVPPVSGEPAVPRVRASQAEQIVIEGLVRGWTHGEIARVMQA